MTLVFDIPQDWEYDFNNYVRGTYSKMSNQAKVKIRDTSNLKYQVRDEKGNKITDAILLALERHRVLQDKWREVLGLNIELPEELLSIPDPKSFIHIDSSSKVIE